MIIVGTKPTFDLAGNVTVTVSEGAGAYSQNSFASNFNANDSGQSLDSYTVSTNNTSLFSAQPAINNSGTLTFTPADDASGSTTVTVIAIDDPDDDDNGSSDPVTFTITISGADDPPTSVSISAITIEENSQSVGTVTATEPFGASLSFFLNGGNDDAFFNIDASSGELAFITAPDFESPADQDTDGIYEISVKVTGSDGSSTRDFEIRVTDVNEAQPIPLRNKTKTSMRTSPPL